MTPFEFILVVLFTRSVIEIWRNGTLFRGVREWIDYASTAEREYTWAALADNILSVNGYLWKLLDCWYCLTPWVAFIGAGFICWSQNYPLWFSTSVFHGLAAAGVVIVLEAFIPPDGQIDRDPKLP